MAPDTEPTEILSQHATSEGTVVYVRDDQGRLQVWRSAELVAAARR